MISCNIKVVNILVVQYFQLMLFQYTRASKGLVMTPKYHIGNNRKPTKKDLPKYDLIIVGSNLGGILSKHYDHITKGKLAIMVCLDNFRNQIYTMRPFYQQGRSSKADYSPFAKMAINMYTAHSDSIGVEKYVPKQNYLVLRNGKKMEYENLVIASGMPFATETIKGFDEAWGDTEFPFYVASDYPTWRDSISKSFKPHLNYKGGTYIFHIPPAPYHGEIECFNFFLSKEIFDWGEFHGKLFKENVDFRIINANDTFCRYCPATDKFIKDELKKRGIPVEYGLKLTEVNKNDKVGVFENVKTGEKSDRPFAQMYSLIPGKGQKELIRDGLATTESGGFLNVDKQTLQHKEYENIFGLGDVNDIPTTKCFYGGFHQIHVVRNNLERRAKGLPLNGHYDGLAEAPLILGQTQACWVQHYYGGKEGSWNLLGASNPILSRIFYQKFKKLKKTFMDLYLFKVWGPPYQRLKKTFSEPAGNKPVQSKTGVASAVESLISSKKETH